MDRGEGGEQARRNAIYLATHGFTPFPAKVNINMKDKWGQTPLSNAARYRHKPILKLLLENKVDIDAKDNNSQTPLSWAAGNGHETVVRLLLENKVNANAKDSYG